MACVLPATVFPAAFPKPLEIDRIEESYRLYNSLPDDSKQRQVDDVHISNLAATFVKYNAHRICGIHLVHGHFPIPNGTILLGTNLDESKGRWTRITKTNEVDPKTIHGHIFVIQDERFVPYEFQEGPLPDFSSVKAGFLEELAGYLTTHKLTDLLGLQILGECNKHQMQELILCDGTIMLQAEATKDCEPTRQTGWRFEAGPHGPRVCQTNETHAKKTSGNHQVFNAGKPQPKFGNVDDLMVALGENGLL